VWQDAGKKEMKLKIYEQADWDSTFSVLMYMGSFTRKENKEYKETKGNENK